VIAVLLIVGYMLGMFLTTLVMERRWPGLLEDEGLWLLVVIWLPALALAAVFLAAVAPIFLARRLARG
jgi:hypothetical protein